MKAQSTNGIAMPRYKANLKIANGTHVLSYNTHVATIDLVAGTIVPHAYRNPVNGNSFSATTQKHINYVASMYNLTVKK